MKLFMVATGNTVECNEEQARALVKARPLAYKIVEEKPVKEPIKVKLEEKPKKAVKKAKKKSKTKK